MQRSEEDKRIFTDLVDAYQMALLRLCHTLLRDRYLAEDAVQDTFLRVWRHMDQIREKENMKPWVFQIAVNRCRDMRRSAWLRHRREPLPENQTEAQAGIPEEAIALNMTIQQLPVKQREVILLYYYQQFTVEEVAGILHISHSSVSGRLKRGLEALAQALEGGNENE